jgi:hypothetical protein
MTQSYPNFPYPTGGPRPGDPQTGGPPPGGYAIPPHIQESLTDPLISLNYNGWWSRGVSIAKRGWKPLATLQALGLILVLLLQAPIAVYAALATEDLSRSIDTSDTNATPDLSPLLPLLGLGLLAALLAIIVTAMVTIATVHVGVSVAIGTPVRIADALHLAARRVFPLLGWQLLAIPIYLLAVCACFLPVFYVAAVFLVLPVVVAVERTNAIGRCFSLFHGNLGSSVARIATIMGLNFGVGIAGGLIGRLFDAAARAASPGTVGVVAGSVSSTLVAAAIGGALAVLLAPLTLAAYADMRARLEPLNTMMIAQQLGIVPPAEPWPTEPPVQSWPAGPPAQSWPAGPSWPTEPLGPVDPAEPPTRPVPPPD